MRNTLNCLMAELFLPFALGLSLSMIFLPSLQAQTAANATVGPKAQAANPTPSGQAPDEMTKKIPDLGHAGKYPEALQFGGRLACGVSGRPEAHQSQGTD
jgi:hypothetical protein